VRESIQRVGHTFVEARILVVIVVLVSPNRRASSVLPLLLALTVALMEKKKTPFFDHAGAGVFFA